MTNNKVVATLTEFGLEISDIQYTYSPSPAIDSFGMPLPESPIKFTLSGEYYADGIIPAVIDELFILRAIHNKKHPVVRDLYEKLKTAAALVNGSQNTE